MAITWLADELRAAGLEVVEHAGWRTRGRPGTWEPRYGIVHATAAPRSQPDDVQVRVVRDGRGAPNPLPGPIANACVDRQGRWHVLAAGRCNTTVPGSAGPYEGLGNTNALGIEACNDNGLHDPPEPWPDVQYRAYVRGWAAIAHRLGWAPDRLRGHREHCPGHKTDPTFSMTRFRADVAAVLAGEDTDMPLTPDELYDIGTAVANRPVDKAGTMAYWAWAKTLDNTNRLLVTAAAQESAIRALAGAVANGDDLDADELAAAVHAGVAAAADELAATLTAPLAAALAPHVAGASEEDVERIIREVISGVRLVTP